MKSQCDDCGWTGEPDIEPRCIPHYFERVDEGGIVPSGECPKCGSLCYPEAGLYVSAFELQKALERLLACPDVCMDSLEPETQEAINQANDALAKAKGAR